MIFTIAVIKNTIPITARIPKAMANPIQSGESTQSQDQVMTLQSLRTMNAIVKSPQKPIPPADADAEADAELLIILRFNVFII